MTGLNTETILLLLARNGAEMELQNAHNVALALMELHYESIQALSKENAAMMQESAEKAYQNGYEAGKVFGTNTGYEKGQEDARTQRLLHTDERREYESLLNMRKNMLQGAEEKVKSIVTEETIKTKIQNIKKLRAEVPGLGLKEAKDIVDARGLTVQSAMKVDHTTDPNHDKNDCWEC